MKALSVDAETLDDDYESWKKNANELIASLQKNGVVAQKEGVQNSVSQPAASQADVFVQALGEVDGHL